MRQRLGSVAALTKEHRVVSSHQRAGKGDRFSLKASRRSKPATLILDFLASDCRKWEFLLS